MPERVVATLKLPIMIADFGLVADALEGRYPQLWARGAGDGTLLELFIDDEVEASED